MTLNVDILNLFLIENNIPLQETHINNTHNTIAFNNICKKSVSLLSRQTKKKLLIYYYLIHCEIDKLYLLKKHNKIIRISKKEKRINIFLVLCHRQRKTSETPRII